MKNEWSDPMLAASHEPFRLEYQHFIQKDPRTSIKYKNFFLILILLSGALCILSSAFIIKEVKDNDLNSTYETFGYIFVSFGSILFILGLVFLIKWRYTWMKPNSKIITLGEDIEDVQPGALLHSGLRIMKNSQHAYKDLNRHYNIMKQSLRDNPNDEFELKQSLSDNPNEEFELKQNLRDNPNDEFELN